MLFLGGLTYVCLYRVVKTEAGNEAARASGLPGAITEIEDSVDVMVVKIDALTKDNGAGEFWTFDGTSIGW